MNRRWLGQGVLALVSVGLALACVEGALRLYFSVRRNFDVEMWRYAVALKHPVPDARSHVHRPSLKAWLMGVEISINSHGLRDREIAYEKAPGTFRLLVLGDSLTLGWGVEQDKTYAKLLEKKLNEAYPGRPIEVVNLGIGNYNTSQELALYLSEGVKYRPDAVILGWYLNDAEPIQRYDGGWFARHSLAYVFFSQRLRQAETLLNRDRQAEAYYNALYEGTSWESYRARLGELAREVARHKAALIPVLLPDLRSLERRPFAGVYARLGAAFRDLGAVPIELEADFSGRPSRAYWVAADDPHPNGLAHERIAAGIFRELASRGLLTTAEALR